MKIGVTGFGPIKKAVVDSSKGAIIGITGKNSVGKSAFARAIRAFVLNSSTEKDINDQMSKAVVMIKEGSVYKWERDRKKVAYSKDGEKKSKVNRKPIDEVFPDSGFKVEREGPDLFIPFIVPESTVSFPFNITPSVAFKIFGKFISTTRIDEIIKEIKNNLKEDKDRIKIERAQIDMLESECSRSQILLKSLPGKEDLQRIRDKIVKIEVRRKRLEYVKGYEKIVDEIKRIEKKIDRYNKQKIIRLRKKIEGAVGFCKMGLVLWTEKVVQIRSLLKKIEESEKKIKIAKKSLEIKIRIERVVNKIQVLNRAEIVLGEWEEVKGGKKRLIGEKQILEEKVKEFEFCPICLTPQEEWRR